MKKTGKSLYILFGIGVCTSLGLYFLIEKKDFLHSISKIFFTPKNKVEKNLEENDNNVELALVEQEDKPVTFDTYGTIIGKQEQVIIFDTGGKIAYISDNRYAKKDDVYISLDTTQLDLKKKSTEAQLYFKKNCLNRLQELKTHNMSSISQIEETQKDIVALENQIKEINIQIQSMILRAPSDGYFFVKNTASAVGSVIQARQEIGYFFSQQKQIKFLIPHSFLYNLQPNEQIKVLFFPDFDNNHKPVEGTFKFNLKFIRPMTSNENEHNNSVCEVIADLIENEDVPPMFYNQNGKIRVIFQQMSSYCLIPEIAVLNRGVKSFVYVIQDNIAILTEIKILGTTPDGYVKVCQNDIIPGTTIVLRGIYKIHHMSKINIYNNQNNNTDKNNDKNKTSKTVKTKKVKDK